MVEPTIAKYVEDMKDKGFDAKTIESHIQFIREKVPYWTEQQAKAGVASPYTEK